MGLRRPVPERGRQLDHGLALALGLPAAALDVADEREPAAQSHPDGGRGLRLVTVEPAEAATDRPHRLDVAPGALGDPRLLEQDGRDRDRLALAQAPGGPVGGERTVVEAGALTDVAQLLPGARQVGSGHVRAVPARCRPRAAAARSPRRWRTWSPPAARRHAREAPRVVVAAHVEVVEREDLGLDLGMVAEGRGDRVAHARVELPSAPERQLGVGRVAHERVAEPQCAGPRPARAGRRGRPIRRRGPPVPAGPAAARGRGAGRSGRAPTRPARRRAAPAADGRSAR